MDKLPIYKLSITDDDTDESGVVAIALVKEPAIKNDWQAFSKHYQFKTTDEEKRIISGPLIIPDKPIYRNDTKRGEYYVMFDAETIYKIVKKYFRNKATSNVNIMHDPASSINGAYLIESFFIDNGRGVLSPKGWDLQDGSWFASFKIDNDNIWQEYVKTGLLKGFSVEGFFSEEKIDELTEKELARLENVLMGK